MIFGVPIRDLPVVAMPTSCKATLALAAAPLLAIGIYVPGPLQDLLKAAASAMGG
jgi:hypothetical protein